MKKKIVFAGILAVSLLITATSCKKDEDGLPETKLTVSEVKEKIIGSWREASRELYDYSSDERIWSLPTTYLNLYTFNQDGTFIMKQDNKVLGEGEYEIQKTDGQIHVVGDKYYPFGMFISNEFIESITGSTMVTSSKLPGNKRGDSEEYTKIVYDKVN